MPLSLALLAAAVLGGAPASPPPPPRPPPDPAEAARAEAFRELARLGAGEPTAAEVQAAAAARAGPPPDPGAPARARLAALLPRLTAEYQRDERSYRVAGYQTSGEVDYARYAPGNAMAIRATWELGALVAPAPEAEVAREAAERGRRREDAVRRATALYFERQRLRAALALDPPATARDRALAELEVDRVTAELDALVGGLYTGRAP